MKILISIPNWSNPHGGLRVIMEWANRLLAFDHDVYLYNMKGETRCDWFGIDHRVKLCDISKFWECETVILTSPHSSHLLDLVLPHQKCFLFLQMMEHMFKPNDPAWLIQCKKFYSAPYPMICISKWNMDMLQAHYRPRETLTMQTGIYGDTIPVGEESPPIHYVGNGVNTKDFPIMQTKKDGKVVLVEGWECTNPSKDSENIAHAVAQRLRNEGFTIIAYSGIQIRTNKPILHESFCRPNINVMNNLYARASILIKASKYDARSCSPMEAMTKGTVTARAIMYGDDDLIHNENALRCGYNTDELYANAKSLLGPNSELRDRLSNAAIEYVKKYSWNYWMDKINDIICNRSND